MFRSFVLRPTGLFFQIFFLHLLLSGIAVVCLCLWGMRGRKRVRTGEWLCLAACALAIAAGVWYFKPFRYTPEPDEYTNLRVDLGVNVRADDPYLPESEFEAVYDCIMPLYLRVPLFFEDKASCYQDVRRVGLRFDKWGGTISLTLLPADSGPSTAQISHMGPSQRDTYTVCNPEALRDRLDPYFEVQSIID